VVVDGKVRLLLPTVGLAVNVDSGRRVGVDVVVQLLDGRWVRLHHFPALAVVELHPVILAIFHLAGALECLREQLAEVVVVGCVFEAKVSHVAEVLVELLCWILVTAGRGLTDLTHQGSYRTDP